LIGLVFIETVCQGGSRGFVDDAENVESGDDRGIFGCLALTVVEVSRDSDYYVFYLFPQIGGGDVCHLGENHCRNFLGVEGLFFVIEGDLDETLLGTAGCVGFYGEGIVLEIALDAGVVELLSNESFSIKYSIGCVL